MRSATKRPRNCTAELNGKYRFEATLSSQLGVLPSYTALGMASLLPHKTLAYKGPTFWWTASRALPADGTASCRPWAAWPARADELMAKKKDEGREFVKDKRVVYIYHNTVDAIGDDCQDREAKLQGRAAGDRRMAALVGYIVNNLNGHHIVVTADHGFLFTRRRRSRPDKSKLNEKPEKPILAKKRYLIGPDLPDHECGLARQAERDGRRSKAAWSSGFPRGANRFHFVGGARFVHGGAMPQEIVVPVVTVKQFEGKSAQETKIRPVTVQVLGSQPPDHDRLPPLPVDPDGAGQRAGEADHAEGGRLRGRGAGDGHRDGEVRQRVRQHGRAEEVGETGPRRTGNYNKKTPYRLVLRDAETGIEQQSVEVIIDRAFTDDF